MAKNPLLSREKIKNKYPDQWLLLEDCELDASTSLRKGRVLASGLRSHVRPHEVTIVAPAARAPLFLRANFRNL